MTDTTTFDIDGILKRLPHRYPFLMIDRVLEVVPGKSIVAVKNVSATEAHFEGHFPGHPVMPGVLIVEALAQAGGVLAYESVTAEERIWILYLVGLEECRYPLHEAKTLRLSLTAFEGVGRDCPRTRSSILTGVRSRFG